MNWARAFFGILIVALGAVLLLDVAGVVDAGDAIADWWPLVLLGAGVAGLLTNPRHWLMPMIVALGGLLLLMRTTGVVDSLALVWPLLLIAIGVLIVFGWGWGEKRAATPDHAVSSFNIFSGSEIASHSDRFEGGKIGAMFGGAEVDLTHARLAPESVLDVFVAFGGVEIRVPQGWRVDIGGFPIFGGFENITAKEALPSDPPVLRIDATVLFGGLEVKH